MRFQICPLQSSLAELFAEVSNSGRITTADRYGLMATLLQDSVSEEEMNTIDRLLYGVRRGRLKVGDGVSGMV